LTITADCDGSNGTRVRLWKVELQKLADETGLVLRVRHYPPGTSKWNRIEHRLFCHITAELARTTVNRPGRHRRADLTAKARKIEAVIVRNLLTIHDLDAAVTLGMHRLLFSLNVA
jgi:hypothetical protein